MFSHRLLKSIVFVPFILVGAADALAAPNVAEATTETTAPLTAVWRAQQIELNLRSGRIYYSCDALKQKIAAILGAVGAREGTHVHMPCRTSALTNNASAVITVTTPIEATPANVAAITTYTTEMQLAARANGVRLPTANDIHRFSAEWRAIALNKQRRLGIDGGDCNLLKALSTQVFPHLAVQVTTDRFSCPDGAMQIRPKLHVMALMPLPADPRVLVADQPRVD